MQATSLDSLRGLVEDELAAIWGSDAAAVRGPAALAPLAEAIEYSLLAPGKRIRPVLVLAAAEACGLSADGNVARVAAAFELVHAYSLVHDDLPSMDDDDVRRGMPTSHVRYGEAVAVLVGDALQAEAFRLVATSTCCSAEQRLAVVELLARAAGWAGMVGGQYLDIESERAGDDVAALREMHALKTGALIAASVEAGAILGGSVADGRRAFAAFGRELGLLFQLVDDLLDVVGDETRTGRPSGSDARQEKLTAVGVLGLEGLHRAADEQLERCLDLAAELPSGGGLLPDIARFVHGRDH